MPKKPRTKTVIEGDPFLDGILKRPKVGEDINSLSLIADTLREQSLKDRPTHVAYHRECGSSDIDIGLAAVVWHRIEVRNWEKLPSRIVSEIKYEASDIKFFRCFKCNKDIKEEDINIRERE